jgi:hypothetical protein
MYTKQPNKTSKEKKNISCCHKFCVASTVLQTHVFSLLFNQYINTNTHKMKLTCCYCSFTNTTVLVVITTLLVSLCSVTVVEGSGRTLGQSNRILVESTNPFLVNTTNTTIDTIPNATDTTTGDDVDAGTGGGGDDDTTTDDDVALSGLAIYGISTTVSPLLNWPEGKCITNLTWIFIDVFLKGQFEPRKYHLCPNTTYEIGLDEMSHCCLENKFPPFVLRSYTEFICGDDGKSSNNCIIHGGDFQIMSNQHEFTGEPSKEIKFRGVTFANALLMQILIANEGDFYFDDCIFKVCVLITK